MLESVFNTTFLLEIPSFTGSLNINNGVIAGSLTFSINDLVADPITLNVYMDSTRARLYGSGGLIYQGSVFNSSHLDYLVQFMNNLTGTGEYSLYNMTNTYLLATYSAFNYTNTTFVQGPGANFNIDFRAQNTTWGLWKVLFANQIYNFVPGADDGNVTAAVMYEYEKILAKSVGGSTISYDASYYGGRNEIYSFK